MRAVRSGFGFGCRRGCCRIGLVIVVGKHGCWPPENYFALGSRQAAPRSVEKNPCCFPIGVIARRSTTCGSLRREPLCGHTLELASRRSLRDKDAAVLENAA